MASLAQTITIQDKHRPCLYSGYGGNQYKAIFHRWVEIRELLAASPFEGGHPAGCVADTFALIEVEDGTMRMLRPDKIRFLDHDEFETYIWGEE